MRNSTSAEAAQAPISEEREQLEARALRSARALVDRMRALYRELEELTGAPITMHRALNVIGTSPGIQASQLASQLDMRRPAVSQLLKNMAARGWVRRTRDEADQRAVRVYLTSEGQRLVRATAGRAVGTLHRAVQSLDAQSLERLASALPALVQSLPEAPVTASRAVSPHRRSERAPRADRD